MQPGSGVLHTDIELTFWALYRDFFDKAEKKRRWSIRDDIPWDQCNRHLDPAIADVVESFCAIELYLPDYTSKILPVVRSSRGRAWFYANWGYEESKHSLALGDWLLRGGHRTEGQLQDMDNSVFEREWSLKYNDPLASVVYTMVQEVATRVNYRNLRKVAGVYKEGKAVDRERLPETRVLSMAPAAPGTRSAAQHQRAAGHER